MQWNKKNKKLKTDHKLFLWIVGIQRGKGGGLWYQKRQARLRTAPTLDRTTDLVITYASTSDTLYH